MNHVGAVQEGGRAYEKNTFSFTSFGRPGCVSITYLGRGLRYDASWGKKQASRDSVTLWAMFFQKPCQVNQLYLYSTSIKQSNSPFRSKIIYVALNHNVLKEMKFTHNLLCKTFKSQYDERHIKSMSVVCMLKTLKLGNYVDVTLTCITYLIKLYQTSESDLSDFDCAMVVGAEKYLWRMAGMKKKNPL